MTDKIELDAAGIEQCVSALCDMEQVFTPDQRRATAMLLTELFARLSASKAVPEAPVEGVNAHDIQRVVETDRRQGVQGTDTSAWLIERTDDTVPLWYWDDPYRPGWHDWTNKAHEAKRFTTKEAAEAFPDYKLIAGNSYIKITEHVFIDSFASPPKTYEDGPKVKALEWEERTSPREDGPAETTGDWTGIGILGAGYGVYIFEDHYEVTREDGEFVESHLGDLDEAKAAAQADYEKRILSALIGAPK